MARSWRRTARAERRHGGDDLRSAAAAYRFEAPVVTNSFELEAQIGELDAQQTSAGHTAADDTALARLIRLKGVAVTSASTSIDEGLVWRAFHNRRQIGGILGFAPTPYDSGQTCHEQGISRAGNPRLQAVAIQLAWNWLRWQPDSPLTRWYRDRFASTKRLRRIGIVALARRLMIALWRCATTGRVPAQAILKLT